MSNYSVPPRTPRENILLLIGVLLFVAIFLTLILK
jgi:hypothetical protein